MIGQGHYDVLRPRLAVPLELALHSHHHHLQLLIAAVKQVEQARQLTAERRDEHRSPHRRLLFSVSIEEGEIQHFKTFNAAVVRHGTVPGLRQRNMPPDGHRALVLQSEVRDELGVLNTGLLQVCAVVTRV